MMNAKRLAAVVLIYFVTAVAWMILAGATSYRSQTWYGRLASGDVEGRATVQQLWGPPQIQPAPKVWTTHIEKQTTLNEKGKRVQVEVRKTDPVVLSKSRIRVNIESEPRQKGLLWYATYRVKFSGDWAFANEFKDQR
jgi:hypothetical protein